jgi:putative SOS response-associated peptidase YedK
MTADAALMIGMVLLKVSPMCGLYSFRRAPEEARTLFNYIEQPNFPPRQYVTPGSPIAIVREVAPGKPLINARSETVLEKPSFRHAIKRRRCLIPADGFYEWEGDIPGKKRPYYIHRPDHSLMAFAGIWEHWMGADGSELETAAMITTDANALVQTIHTRSPVIIHPQDFDLWLACKDDDIKLASALMHKASDDYFEMEPTLIARNAPPAKQVASKPKPPQLDLF